MDSESPAGRCWLGKSCGHQVLRLRVDNGKVHPSNAIEDGIGSAAIGEHRRSGSGKPLPVIDIIGILHLRYAKSGSILRVSVTRTYTRYGVSGQQYKQRSGACGESPRQR